MSFAVSDAVAVVDRAVRLALATRAAQLAALLLGAVITLVYLFLLPASSTGGVIGLVTLRYLTMGEVLLALAMGALLALSLMVGVHGLRHGGRVRSAGGAVGGSAVGAILALAPSLLCCSPILPLGIAALASIIPAAGGLGLPIQGFLATHTLLIYALSLLLMSWGLYSNAKRVVACGC
ncbi:hypothetical protein ACOSOMT5_P1687 [Acidiphilium sp. MT5]